MITYRATLDVPAQTVGVVSAWLLTHRLAHDVRPWQRAATAYRYVHEAIDVIAAGSAAERLGHIEAPGRPSCTTCSPKAWTKAGRSCAWTAL